MDDVEASSPRSDGGEIVTSSAIPHRPSSPLRADSNESGISAAAREKLKGMTLKEQPVKTAPIFARPANKRPTRPVPGVRSSSPPPSSDPFEALHSSQIPGIRPRVNAGVRPVGAGAGAAAGPPKILAVEIPISSLRPLAVRVFTKKHNLTLKTEALSLLCSFIGRKCGAEWRNNGSGEKLLEEIARTWKRNEGPSGIMVDGGESLKAVLRSLDIPAGGAAKVNVMLQRGESFDFASGVGAGKDPEDSQASQSGTASLLAGDALDDVDPRDYLKFVDAFSQPRLSYNSSKKQFERSPKPSLFPGPLAKSQVFHTRYNLLYHRLLRNPSFQPPTFTPAHKQSTRGTKTYYKLTLISNLLGRPNEPFLLFGLLSVAPETGTLSLEDPTGTVKLDMSQATPIPVDGAWFNPGSFAIVDGVYERSGVFTVFTIGQPPCERRDQSAEVFAHVDLLGVNIPLEFSGAGQAGGPLRLCERKLAAKGSGRVVVLSDVHLDLAKTHDGLNRLFTQWEDDAARSVDPVELPLICIFCGQFVSQGFGWDGGSMGYKEAFNSLASTMSTFARMLDHTTFVFVPSDSDPWTAAFSGGASGVLPRRGVPDAFTNRLKRLFAQATTNKKFKGKVIFSSNPTRISYFTKEIVIFRDEMGGRFLRNSVRFKQAAAAAEHEEDEEMDLQDDNEPGRPSSHSQRRKGRAQAMGTQDSEEGMDVDGVEGTMEMPTAGGDEMAAPGSDIPEDIKAARRLVKTVLDQSYLSPYPINIRPVLWEYAHTLSLFPLPSYLLLCDPSSPAFDVTYEGCCVLNPGKFLTDSGGKKCRYVEFVVGAEKGGGRLVEFYI